jgi:hypothetical protein
VNRCTRGVAVLTATLGLTLTACEKAPPLIPFKSVATNKAVMAEVLEPAADVYWDAVGSTSDKNGFTEHAPKNDDEWKAVIAAATVIAESGNLLMMPPRALDQGDWMTLAREMVEAGVQARTAAQAHDVQKVFDAGAVVYETCTKCHAKYVIPAATPPK